MGEIRRMMAFIDGDNLLVRYQAMKAAGREPVERAFFEQDKYVWRPDISAPGELDIIRANYYVSVVGDENECNRVFDALKVLPAIHVSYPTAFQLSPVVFKKENRTDKAKGVDIQLAVDLLT